LGLNGGAFVISGPSLEIYIMGAERRAANVVALIVNSQFKPPRPLIKWGVADPKVNAPTKRPTKNPVSPFVQVTTILIPIGYIPAIETPVKNLMRRAIGPLGSTNKKHILIRLAKMVDIIKNFLGGKRSASPKRALIIVPIIKPIVTKLERKEVWIEEISKFC